MPEIRYTLLADGTSDRALMPHLTWLLRQQLPFHAVQAEMAELWRLPKPPKGLAERMDRAISLYPCDVLFVHRDAEREPRQTRVIEIQTAHAALIEIVPIVCVVPIRMQEAWLLFDEAAIRRAANNRYGTVALGLPPLTTVESRPNPKEDLYELLRKATGLGSHRLRKFSESKAALRVSELSDDFSPLRVLSAFAALEADIGIVAIEQNWR